MIVLIKYQLQTSQTFALTLVSPTCYQYNPKLTRKSASQHTLIAGKVSAKFKPTFEAQSIQPYANSGYQINFILGGQNVN